MRMKEVKELKCVITNWNCPESDLKGKSEKMCSDVVKVKSVQQNHVSCAIKIFKQFLDAWKKNGERILKNMQGISKLQRKMLI